MEHHREGRQGAAAGLAGRTAEAAGEDEEEGDFNLDDFRKQLDLLKSMGSMKELIEKMPGMGEALQDADDPEQAMARASSTR